METDNAEIAVLKHERLLIFGEKP